MKVIIDRKKIEKMLSDCSDTETELVIDADEYVGGSYWQVVFTIDGGFIKPNIYCQRYCSPSGKTIADNLTSQGFAYSTMEQASECSRFMMQAALDYKRSVSK